MSDIRLLRVLTEYGSDTGKRLTEDDIHAGDHWHSCVCVCVTDGRGNIYEQHRGFKTKIAPGKYDMFLASDHMVDSDRSPQEAVERALLKRVGVELPAEIFQTMKSVYETTSVYWVSDNTFASREDGLQGYWHRAFEFIYVVCLPGLMTEHPLKLQEGRVQGVRISSMRQVKEDFHMPPDSAAFREYMHRPPDEASILDAVSSAVMKFQDK